MVKLWKGIEKEGIGADSEIMTLFICSDGFISFDFICSILQSHSDIKGLYFGAGRREFVGMTQKDWDKLLLYCDKNDISIVIEVSPIMLNSFVHIYNHKNVTFIVAYYNAPKNINKLYFKTDDFLVTKIFTSQKDVDITTVEEDRYPDDELIYEEM